MTGSIISTIGFKLPRKQAPAWPGGQENQVKNAALLSGIKWLNVMPRNELDGRGESKQEAILGKRQVPHLDQMTSTRASA